MNNGFSPIDLPAERKQCRENVITIVLGSEPSAFRKRIEQAKCQRIQCNHQHYFWALNRMLGPFEWSLFWAKLYILMIWRKVEPGITKGGGELPSMMFHRTDLAE
jgi:hypothetical protein